jgi:hypothetical protein
MLRQGIRLATDSPQQTGHHQRHAVLPRTAYRRSSPAVFGLSLILAGVLPLAAAGTTAPMTRTWIRRVVSWMLVLIFYKPAAAVYAAAFTMIGSGGPRTMLMGFVMPLSVVTLPVLMKFFTWTTGSVAGTGGGGQMLGAAAMGAVAVGAMRGPPGGGVSGAAQDQAAYLSSRLGSPPGGAPPVYSGQLARLLRATAPQRRREPPPSRPSGATLQHPGQRAKRSNCQHFSRNHGQPGPSHPGRSIHSRSRECRVRRICRRRRSSRSAGDRRGNRRRSRRRRRRWRPGRCGCRAPGYCSDGTRGLAMTPEHNHVRTTADGGAAAASD